MRKFLQLAFFLVVAVGAWAQAGNTVTIGFAGVPSGSCSTIMYAINTSNGDFYDCLSGAWNKVNSAGGSGVTSIAATAPITVSPNPITTTGTVACATCTTNAAALTSNAVVLGAGGQATQVVGGITTDGISKLNLATGGVFTINSDTGLSRDAAGQWDVGNGTAGNKTGFFNMAGATFGAGVDIGFNRSGISLAGNSTQLLCWTSGAASSNAIDTCLSRNAAGVTQFGTSAANSSGSIKAAAHLTDTNCAGVGTAANPSVVTCTAASAGSFSCATNASTGTCQVNTTAVTANSEIFIEGRNDTTTGTRLGVTCNTGITTALPEIAAVTAGTSFTINLGTFTTNPECFSYFIVN